MQHRSWPGAVRPKLLGAFVLAWNLPISVLLLWLVAGAGEPQLFERLCVLQAFLFGIALLAVALSPRLQRWLFVQEADVGFLRRRLYVGGAFWTLASITVYLFLRA